MKVATKTSEMNNEKSIEEYRVAQLVAGLELRPADEHVIKYINFLSDYIPIGSACFLHVVTLPEILKTTGGKDGNEYMLNRGMINQLKYQVEGSVKKENFAHIEVDLKDGNPLRELLDVATDCNADLVVIGQRTNVPTHGIFANRLARQSNLNTLIIPDKAEMRLKRILIPTDYSENSIRALKTAISIARQMEEDVELICFSVFEMPDFTFYNIQRSPEEYRNSILAGQESAMDALLSTLPTDQRDKLTCVIEEREESVSQSIYQYAVENNVDMVVLGAKGHSNLDLVLMGSVSEQLLSINERIPLLIVR